MGEAPAQDGTAVFEVFRVGTVNHDALLSRDFDEVKRKYLLITPINTKEEVKKDSFLAVIPPPNHMIVDQTKFRQLVAQQAVDIAGKKTTEVLKRSENTIELVKNECVAEVGRIFKDLQEIINEQKTQLKSVTAKAFETTDLTLEQRQKMVQDAMATFDAKIDALVAQMASAQSDLESREFSGSLDEIAEGASESS